MVNNIKTGVVVAVIIIALIIIIVLNVFFLYIPIYQMKRESDKITGSVGGVVGEIKDGKSDLCDWLKDMGLHQPKFCL